MPAVPALVIIADDLTGALDVAAPFAARGLRTRVVPWAARQAPAQVVAAARRCDVLVIETASRHLAASTAAARVSAAARAARQAGVPRLYKKIDSTLRGAVLAELRAFRRAMGVSMLPVIPAFPAQGRTVRQGEVHIHGVPVRQTSVAHDPRGGPVEQTLTTLRQPSAGFELIDAETDADLRRIAGVLARADRLGATAGAGGFAAALAALMASTSGAMRAIVGPGTRSRAIRGRPAASSAPAASAAIRSAGPLLIVVGSPHPATRAQLRQAAAAGVRGLVLPVADGRSRFAWARDRDATVDVASTWLAQGDDVFVALPAPEGALVPRQASRAAAALADTALRVMRRARPDVVVAVGGDTVAALLRAAGVPHLDVVGELRHGVALASWPRDRAQRAAPRWLVTKSGAFGDEDLLNDLCRQCG